LRIRAFEPTFTVDDVERSERFYTEVVGFVVDQRWTEDGRLQGVLLKAGTSRIGLSQDDWARGRDRKKGVGFSVWCQTDQDIDALAARIKGAGGRLAAEPKDEAGLGRALAVDDPDGFRLRIYRRQ
jgi:catechol 2,3-dioxygenase-like lactoylglutathione lyase family enzyme